MGLNKALWSDRDREEISYFHNVSQNNPDSRPTVLMRIMVVMVKMVMIQHRYKKKDKDK